MNRYVNMMKVNTAKVVKTILYIVGGVTGFFHLFFLLFLIFGFAPENQETPDDVGMNIAMGVMFGVFLAISVLMIVVGLRMGKRIKRSMFYNSVFESDADGIVEKQELIDQTGMQIFDIMKELDALITKNYLKNCALRRGSDPAVMLTVENAVAGLLETVVIKCPACGGTLEIRKGSSTTCEYCGAPVKG
ncbi:MAG: hypothetical protein ILP19_00925 [Oscillospiraceae bacterium]|nr:hypothetical protein [Oscillospiraceae bacterium]